MTVLEAYLREHGPTPMTDCPTADLNYSDRLAGVTTFRVTRNGSGGNSAPLGGHPEPVAYIHGEHDKTAVIKAWLAANPTATETLSPRALAGKIRQHGRSWGQAVETVLATEWETNLTEAAASGTGGTAAIETCPLCGAEITDHLPTHLPECPER